MVPEGMQTSAWGISLLMMQCEQMLGAVLIDRCPPAHGNEPVSAAMWGSPSLSPCRTSGRLRQVVVNPWQNTSSGNVVREGFQPSSGLRGKQTSRAHNGAPVVS
jgi:hypothetical protein